MGVSQRGEGGVGGGRGGWEGGREGGREGEERSQALAAKRPRVLVLHQPGCAATAEGTRTSGTGGSCWCGRAACARVASQSQSFMEHSVM